MPFTGFRGVLPGQGRPSRASHPVQPVRPLPMAFLLRFLLRQRASSRATALALNMILHTLEPDNCTPPTVPPAPGWISIAASSPASRPFVLATLRALRLDPD